MTLKELSLEYRESGLVCKARADKLKPLLRAPELCEMERLRLRRRIYILEAMGKEAMATANYLKNYYGDEAYDDNRQGRRVSGAEELPQACIGKSGKHVGACALRCGGSTYAAAASACGNVLYPSDAHALYRP